MAIHFSLHQGPWGQAAGLPPSAFQQDHAGQNLQEPLGAPNGIDEQQAAMQLDHAAFYDLANKECDLLKVAFGGACRFASMTIGVMGQSYNPMGFRVATASATFELIPQSPGLVAKP